MIIHRKQLQLKQGKTIQCPVYDYAQHNRSTQLLEISPSPIILVEGILLLHAVTADDALIVDEQFEGKFDEEWSANGGDEIGTIQINGQDVEVKALVEGILHRLRYDTSWIAPLVGFIVALAMIAGSFGIALKVFLLNPLEVSGRRFFTANLYDKASLSELGFCFTTNYLNIVKTMFFRGLYNWLWYLLLVVPGIIKSYEYTLVPYIVAENPHDSLHYGGESRLPHPRGFRDEQTYDGRQQVGRLRSGPVLHRLEHPEHVHHGYPGTVLRESLPF